MILRSLHLRSFRAHDETRVDFADQVNLIHGRNGAGKTNLLEAIHYLCLAKSFIATSDSYALRKGESFFELEGVFEGERRPELKVRLAYVPSEGKRVFVNGAPLDRLADIVGQLPVVVCSPEDAVLTAGGPDERRRFLDNILCQARPVYLDDLLKYRRVLRQRNELLSQHRRMRRPVPPSILESWNAELVTIGSRVIAGRLRFITGFAEFLEQAYSSIEAVAERPTITYQSVSPLAPSDDEEAIAEKYREALQQVAAREHERGLTLAGPHRDELVFRLNGLLVRRYASQGQHRTFGMALKLAQYFYLVDRLEEHPLLLLDDVFDHLDERRTAAFLALVQSDEMRQTLITATQRGSFDRFVPFEKAEHRVLHVTAGQVEADNPPEAMAAARVRRT